MVNYATNKMNAERYATDHLQECPRCHELNRRAAIYCDHCRARLQMTPGELVYTLGKKL